MAEISVWPIPVWRPPVPPMKSRVPGGRILRGAVTGDGEGHQDVIIDVAPRLSKSMSARAE